MMAKVQTLKVSFAIGRPVKRDGFACRDEGQRAKPLGSRMMVVNGLRASQSAGGAPGLASLSIPHTHRDEPSYSPLMFTGALKVR